MWAYIKNNKVEEIIKISKPITINGITHPKDIFSVWSESQLNDIGIVKVIDSGTKGTDFFETTSEATYTYNASDVNVTTSYTITSKDLDELKTLAIEQTKTKANGLIKQFSWLVERFIYDSSKTIPDVVKTYVTAIRGDSNTIETEITNAGDMTAFKKLYSDGTIDTWTDNSNVINYRR
tara:strand:+ start:993 stop:1529 length:537 start_codon:yes stop_codon:yes gene_type:complete